MKRLIKSVLKKSYEIGEKVRFVSRANLGFFIVLYVDSKNDTYQVGNESGMLIKDVEFEDIVGENEFIVGDKVVYDTHPYDNTTIYEVTEVLADGTYFIENGDGAYSTIHGKNLTLVSG